MNERIKELAEQALKTSMVHDGMYRPEGYANGVSKDFADKFAELIVRECVSICEDTEGDPIADSRWGRRCCALEIKEHFGVEE
jgi:hypothetical protein